MDGFKNSTRMQYMCGGPVKKAGGGGVFNERGQRATNAEIAAEGRRMEGRKPPVEGISTRPTDSSGRRMTDAELGLTGPAKKPMPKGSGMMPAALAASKKAAGMMKPVIRRSKGGLTAMPKGKC